MNNSGSMAGLIAPIECWRNILLLDSGIGCANGGPKFGS